MTTATQESSKKNTKRTIAVGSLAGLLALTGSFAYFTDRVEDKAVATAGVVDLALESDWQDVLNFNPGDQLDLGYEIHNEGNKSVDVRERIVVKSSVAMDPSDQAEFEVYRAADVEQADNGSYVPKQGAEPVATGEDRIVSDDNTSITYEISQYTLNGTGANAEVEDGINETSKASDYVLVFKGESANQFMAAETTVDLVAEAKQHRNTDDDTWAAISTESVTVGGAAMNVVPEK